MQPEKKNLFRFSCFESGSETFILVPDSMIGLLLSHTHLLGHSGLQRMLLDMDSYWFPRMYTITQSFISRCYACFLSYKGTRKTKKKPVVHSSGQRTYTTRPTPRPSRDVRARKTLSTHLYVRCFHTLHRTLKKFLLL